MDSKGSLVWAKRHAKSWRVCALQHDTYQHRNTVTMHCIKVFSDENRNLHEGNPLGLSLSITGIPHAVKTDLHTDRHGRPTHARGHGRPFFDRHLAVEKRDSLRAN